MPQSAATKTVPLVVVLTLLWGTTWAMFPMAVREISVWTFRAVSLVGAGLLLLAFARARGIPATIPRAYWRPVGISAIVYLSVWNVASTFAAILIPSGQAAVLGYTMPVWAVLITWIFLGERPTARTLLGVVFAAAGVGLLIAAARGAYSHAPAGFVLGLAAGVGWAIGTIVLKRAKVPAHPIVLTGWQLLVAAIPLAVGALHQRQGDWFLPSWQTWLVTAYITVVPMAIGNVLWFSIAGLLPPSIAGLSSVAVPVVAMVTGAIALREPLGPLQLAAMGCCGLALFLALGRKSP